MVLRYLKGTRNNEILVERQQDVCIIGFVDSDYAEDLDKPQSRKDSTKDMFSLVMKDLYLGGLYFN